MFSIKLMEVLYPSLFFKHSKILYFMITCFESKSVQREEFVTLYGPVDHFTKYVELLMTLSGVEIILMVSLVTAWQKILELRMVYCTHKRCTHLHLGLKSFGEGQYPSDAIKYLKPLLYGPTEFHLTEAEEYLSCYIMHI